MLFPLVPHSFDPHRVADFSSCRYCFYTGSDSSLPVPDPIQRSHSASSVEELLSSSSPRLGSYVPSGLGANSGWQSPSAMTGTPRMQSPMMTPRMQAVAMTGVPMVSSEDDIAGMVGRGMMKSGSVTPVAPSTGVTGSGLRKMSPRTTSPFTPLVA